MSVLEDSVVDDVLSKLAAEGGHLIRPEAAAAILGVSLATLRKWRRAGEGPSTARLRHKIFYDLEGVIALRPDIACFFEVKPRNAHRSRLN
jgi:hypothetical protein